jgi:hypothetical protein
MNRMRRPLAASTAHRRISTKELADYVIKRVEELAKAQKAEQEPLISRGATPMTTFWRTGEQTMSKARCNA